MERGETNIALDRHERYHDALDLMRNNPEAGRQAGIAFIDEAHLTNDTLASLGGELVLAYADFYQNRLEQADAAFKRLEPQFEKFGDRRCLSLCLFGMFMLQRHNGQTHHAYGFGHNRLLPALSAEPTRESVLALNGMGIVAQEYGRSIEAIRHLYAALHAARSLALPKRVAHIAANIGQILSIIGNAEDAESMLIEARLLVQQSDESWLVPLASSVLALCQFALGKYEEAYETITDQLDDVERKPTSDFSHRIFCLLVVARRRAMLDQLDEAEHLCKQALSLLDQPEVAQWKPCCWWMLGHLHHRRGNHAQAIILLNRAVTETNINGFMFVPLHALKELAEIHAEQGGWEAAYRVHQRYQEYFAQVQGQASHMRLQIAHIQNELKEADLTRGHAQDAMAERKRLEDHLKQSVAERDTILDNSIVGIVLLTPDGRMQWANRALVEMFGAQESGHLGKSLEPYYSSREEYLRIGGAVSEAVRKGKSYEAELCMRREDGTLFWAALSGRAVNPRNLSQGTVWAVMDITKRRQLEEDLSKSEEHHRQVVNNVTECILVVQDGHIVFSNPRVSELTGFTQEELFTMPFATAIHPDDRPLVIDHHMRRLRGEKVEQYYHFRLINQRTQAIIWVELSAVMIEWEGKGATLSFMTDITERRRLEESLKHSMEERMRLQTLQIQNELKEAEVARHLAEETTRAKSMFLANMSHEIRTPMNAIIGMAHLAMRTELNSKQHDYVEKIHSAGISLLGIINDILDFSKIEAGKLDIENVDFNLDDVLNNVATVTSGKAHEKGLEYLFQMPPDIPRNLIGDPLRLGQVLINLINNAVKFTEQGEVYVACQKRGVVDGKVQLEFVVRDTGIGMNPEQAGKLFQAFSQADESTTRKYGGTGLGLSISKAMVELMDGTIWLESELNAGTAMHFTAWFGMVETQQQRQVVLSAINGMRILVVDDNPAARTILAENLSTLPVEVDMAACGEEALSAIRASDQDRPYGIVFTDLRMPGIDGIDLIRQVKRDDVLQSPPRLVLVSAYGREEVRLREEGTLADGFLMKPVSASILVDTMVGLFTPSNSLASTSNATAIPRFRDLSILLVEDNEINQQIAVELMEAAGITVTVASNGRIALETLMIAGPGYYGLVFMDVQMPEMDGHETTRRIRADGRFAGLPIVAMTAHAMVEERERCFASGMDDHLAKPINPSALYQAISTWCPSHAYQVVAPVEPAARTANLNMPDDLVIEGIDVQDGLQRTLGNRAFYLQLLASFRDGQRDIAARIREALDQNTNGSRENAERMAHTLKSVAGQLGATEVQALAGELEIAIRRGANDDELIPLLERVEQNILLLQDELTRVLPDATKTDVGSVPTANNIDDGETHELIQRFAELFREYDSEAIDLLSESNHLLIAALGSDVHKRIARAARQFDFDAALDALDAGARAAGYSIS